MSSSLNEITGKGTHFLPGFWLHFCTDSRRVERGFVEIFEQTLLKKGCLTISWLCSVRFLISWIETQEHVYCAAADRTINPIERDCATTCFCTRTKLICALQSYQILWHHSQIPFSWVCWVILEAEVVAKSWSALIITHNWLYVENTFGGIRCYQ